MNIKYEDIQCCLGCRPKEIIKSLTALGYSVMNAQGFLRMALDSREFEFGRKMRLRDISNV